jgi:hypothetical protein
MWVGVPGVCGVYVYVSLGTAKKDLISGNSILSADCKVLIDVVRFADKKLQVYFVPLEHSSDERIPFL